MRTSNDRWNDGFSRSDEAFRIGDGCLDRRFDGSGGVIAVELTNDAGGDFCWANRLAFEVVGAVSEALCVHLFYHGECTAFALGLALWERSEMGHLCADEQHGTGVGTCGDTAAAADARGSLHGAVRFHFGDGDGVTIRGCTDVGGDEAASLLDAVERGTADAKVAQDGERTGAERFDDDGFSVTKLAHVKLTCGCLARAVGDSVDGE